MFEPLGDFARHGGFALRAKHRRQILQRSLEPVRRLVEHERARFVRQGAERRTPRRGFGGQESFEHETIGGEARNGQRRNHCARTRKRDDFDARTRRRRDQQRPWIAHQGRACVGDQRDACTGLQSRHQRRDTLAFVVLVQ